MIAEFSQWLQWVADHMGPAEFLPSNWLVDLMADYGCADQVHLALFSILSEVEGILCDAQLLSFG